jgi:hypothetical protein
MRRKRNPSGSSDGLITVAAVGAAAWLGYLYFFGGGPSSPQQNPEPGDMLAGGLGVVIATLLFL